jgi:hypothetical protein
VPDRYTKADDLLHPDGGDLKFQDSHWLQWHDIERGIGGFHRLAIHPTLGTSTYSCGVLTHAGDRFRAWGWEIPWSPVEAPAYVVSDTQRIALNDDSWQLQVREPDCELDLRWREYSPMFAYAAKEGVAAAHFEGAGTVTGTVRLGAQTYEVDGVAFRDRSWGARDYPSIAAHRWFAGTFGEDLSFSAVTLMFADGSLHRDGVVLDNGELYRTNEVDIVVHQEADAFSHRGGTLTLRFVDHDDFQVTASAIDGIAFPVAGGRLYPVDTLCVAQAGGRQGVCNVEVSNNLRNLDDGDQCNRHALAAAVRDGLSRRA